MHRPYADNPGDVRADFVTDLVFHKILHIVYRHAISDTARTTALQLTFETSGDDTPARLRVNDVVDELRKDASGAWRFVRRHIGCEMALTVQRQ
jgi:hypothetical protein